MGTFTEQLVREINNGIEKMTDVLNSDEQLPADVVAQLGEVRFAFYSVWCDALPLRKQHNLDSNSWLLKNTSISTTWSVLRCVGF